MAKTELGKGRHSPRSTPPFLRRETPKPLIQEGEDAAHNLRLVILGSSKVGKTAIVTRFLKNTFTDSYTPTIEDFHRKVYRIRGETYRLDILDTSGNHPFPAMRRLSLLTGDLFILVYAIDSHDTFEEVKRLRDQILESKAEADSACSSPVKKKPGVIPMVVVGNKSDKDQDREVFQEDAIPFVEIVPGCAFVETSAKKNIDIDEIFCKLFSLARLPMEMSPSLHRKVQPNYVSSTGTSSSLRGMTIRRKLSDACATIAPNVRRPSIRTDLLILQARKIVGGSTTEIGNDSRCIVQ